MASEQDIKNYLAYWFQLGKGIIFLKSLKVLKPKTIFNGSKFSKEFEDIWEEILFSKEDCFLEGTEQTIKELLTSKWDLIFCARCSLPVPISNSSCLCPCSDLDLWPNTELPAPSLPKNSNEVLRKIAKNVL